MKAILPQVGEPWDSGFGTRCCEEDMGGSHYHCAGCGAAGGMYGHYVKITNHPPYASWGKNVPLPYEGFTCATVIGLLRIFGHDGDLDARRKS